MTWTPSEGLKRAEPLIQSLVEEAGFNGTYLGPLIQWRMIAVIASAIDQALAEGAQPSLPLGNGAHDKMKLEHAHGMVKGQTVDLGPGVWPSFDDAEAVATKAVVHDTFAPMREDEKPKKRRGRPKGPIRITNPVASAMLESEGMVPAGTTAQLVVDNEHLAAHGALPPLSPKKRRGRPKGSGKKAKRAKKAAAEAPAEAPAEAASEA